MPGGLSMYSGKTGFACDSVLEFEVVLASGEVVRANAEENEDLWIALRGGLNNFGIVTSLRLRTFKAGNIWGGVTYYMPETISQLVRGACDFALNEKDQDAHVMASAGYGFDHQVVTCVMYHVQGKENPPSLERFTAMEPQIKQMSTMRTATHLNFCDELSQFSSNGLRLVVPSSLPIRLLTRRGTDSTGLRLQSSLILRSWRPSTRSGKRPCPK